MQQIFLLTSQDGKCASCEIAEEELTRVGLPFEKMPVSKDQLRKMTKKTFFPQIMVGDEVKDIDDIESMYEPLIMEERRHALFPVKYHDLYSLYKKAVASFWTVEEIDLQQDRADWNNLNDHERHFLTHILAFFAGSDGLVMDNLMGNFMQDVQSMEARMFYSYQAYSEAVHSETYSSLIDAYVQDVTEKNRLFDAINKLPTVQKKAHWAAQWMDPHASSFGERLVAFACVEGILFSGAFCSIFWMKNRQKLPGLCFSNELISRDEALHCEFAVALWDHLRNRPSHHRVREIVKGAVEVEEEFITEAIPVRLIGMDSDRMKTYIRFVADRLLKQLHVPPVWNVANPFPWMENISLDGKTNFFEKRVGEYSKHDASGEIGFNEDF